MWSPGRRMGLTYLDRRQGVAGAGEHDASLKGSEVEMVEMVERR